MGLSPATVMTLQDAAGLLRGHEHLHALRHVAYPRSFSNVFPDPIGSDVSPFPKEQDERWLFGQLWIIALRASLSECRGGQDFKTAQALKLPELPQPLGPWPSYVRTYALDLPCVNESVAAEREARATSDDPITLS